MKRITATLLLFFGTMSGAWALEKEPFTMERFNTLKDQGALVLIDIYADWCPTCAKQQKLLESYRQKNPDVDLNVLEVNFDEDKKWVTHFKAPRQSTLILYRGDERLWYSVAETRQSAIYSALNAAADKK